MRRLILFLLCGLYGAFAAGQTLQGFVYDRARREPVPGVAVYLDGTTGYALTDAQGRYSLDINRIFNTSLVFQHMSYETASIDQPFGALPDTVYLDEKINRIEQIVISPQSFSRKEMLKAFRAIFLGESKAGKSCRIKNEEAIFLYYDFQQKALFALADQPLVIENRHLGYDVQFNLREFRADFIRLSVRPMDVTSTIILGTTLFQDKIRPNASRYIIRRWNAYDNSPAELFLAIRENQLNESRFRIAANGEESREERPKPRKVNDLNGLARAVSANRLTGLRKIEDIGELEFSIKDSLSLKVLTVEREPSQRKYAGGNTPELVYAQLTTRYDFSGSDSEMQSRTSRSDIYLLHHTYLIDSYGNFNPIDKVIITGAMSKKRVGDMLPADYEPGERFIP